jgi:acyl-CoA reductase-like NAD-dependent aldehyde dehydrogenase
MVAAGLFFMLWVALPLLGVGCAVLVAAVARRRELSAPALAAIAAEGGAFGLLALALVSA